eukprot:jgi/Botrbrau1/13644/Bobra.0373s0018.1
MLFPADDISNHLKQCVEAVLQGTQFDDKKVDQWTVDCIDTCMKRLSSLGLSYKYVITCLIMQKTGAGLHTATSALWNASTDGTRTVRWENKTMYCILTAFGLLF